MSSFWQFFDIQMAIFRRVSAWGILPEYQYTCCRTIFLSCGIIYYNKVIQSTCTNKYVKRICFVFSIKFSWARFNITVNTKRPWYLETDRFTARGSKCDTYKEKAIRNDSRDMLLIKYKLTKLLCYCYASWKRVIIHFDINVQVKLLLKNVMTM